MVIKNCFKSSSPSGRAWRCHRRLLFHLSQDGVFAEAIPQNFTLPLVPASVEIWHRVQSLPRTGDSQGECLVGKSLRLEVERHLRRNRSRRHIMCSAKRRKEVVERVLVRQVDCGELETHFVLIATEQVVMSDRNIEKTPRRDARRVVVVVLRTRCRYLQEGRSELGSRANVSGTDRGANWICCTRRCCMDRTAKQSGLELLIRAQARKRPPQYPSPQVRLRNYPRHTAPDPPPDRYHTSS